MLKDKLILLLSIVPPAVGIILYYYIGTLFFTDLSQYLETTIRGYINVESTYIKFILTAILAIILFFLVNWTFVLIVTLVASPFNDVISARTEKNVLNQTQIKLNETFGKMFSALIFTLVNESKKILFILSLTLLGLGLSFIPFLVPVSMIISALLLAVGFLDYNWSRHNLKHTDCVKNVTSNFLPYLLSGLFFMAVFSIPIINLFFISYGTVYYAALWTRLTKQL
jgi:CysZ protein